jgi:hypothetical protein
VLAWLWRAIVVGFPSKPGMNALRARVEAVEKLVDQFMTEVKEQRGRIATALRARRQPADSEKSLEDAPGETNEQPSPGYGHYPMKGTAHLARRFRSGG